MRRLFSFLLALMFLILVAGMSFAVDKKEEVQYEPHPLTIALPGILLIGLGAAIFFSSQQHQGMTVATIGDSQITLQDVAQVFGVLWGSVGVALGAWGVVEAVTE